MILGLTFTLGALVGRQWARHAPADRRSPIPRARRRRPVGGAGSPRRRGAAARGRGEAHVLQDARRRRSSPTPFLRQADRRAKPRARPGPDSPGSRRSARPATELPVKTARRQRSGRCPGGGASAPDRERARAADQLTARTAARGEPEWTVQVGVFGKRAAGRGRQEGARPEGLRGAQIAPIEQRRRPGPLSRARRHVPLEGGGAARGRACAVRTLIAHLRDGEIAARRVAWSATPAAS